MGIINKNEIRKRANYFSKRWEKEENERKEKDTFWNEFFTVFGLDRKNYAIFEQSVKKINNNKGFIDLFWPGKLIVEHKSKGQNLEKAFQQASEYFLGLKEDEKPKYILVSDFEKFKLYDLEKNEEHSFLLKELSNKIELFNFISGHEKKEIKEEDPVNIKAAYLMGKLHDQLEENGYQGHELEILLVRLLFCLFADDTEIFNKNDFQNLIESKTNIDGSDLGIWLCQFFDVLNTPEDNRQTNLDEDLKEFPYINGDLFAENLRPPNFNSKMRKSLLECSDLDWRHISPAIFGSMFQSVMDPDERRMLGAHYTSEKNILKLIKPLFLDELHTEFGNVKGNLKKLKEFHHKLSKLKFLDPACGCGNFLVITYRELRLLELEVLRKIYKNQIATSIEGIVILNVDQFYGIEIDEFPARIAEVAMWLMDHQMNMLIGKEFGQTFARLPLKKAAKIVHTNAIRTNWEEVIPKTELSYIIGNPPFVGSKLLDTNQREEMSIIFDGVKKGKILDYVTAWYLKAAQYIENTSIEVAFVSTNSISQGEQVSILWPELFNNYNIKLHFAHRTFKWSNQAKGKAAVYCVIIGFSNYDIKNKYLFDYEDINGDPKVKKVKNLNPYLVDAGDIFIDSRSKPICDVPKMAFGNMPLDGGNLIIEDAIKKDFLTIEPKAKKYILPLISAREFINNKKRWCLWLENINPQELRQMPVVLKRVEAVRQFRLASIATSTQKHALTPTLFRDRNRPKTFIVIPRVSSENRKYIPMGFFNYKSIVSDTMLSIPNGTLFDFGVLMSEMHMSWVKSTCGRLKSDYRYSKDLVYNNFPWPKELSAKNKNSVEEKAQKVLDVRAKFTKSSLADLYHPLTMPPKLTKAHNELDNAVSKCYRSQAFKNDASRIEHLFSLYKEYTV